MNNKTKLEIKATIIVILHITSGIFVSNNFTISSKHPYILGFIVGVLGAFVLTLIWFTIKEFLKDE